MGLEKKKGDLNKLVHCECTKKKHDSSKYVALTEGCRESPEAGPMLTHQAVRIFKTVLAISHLVPRSDLQKLFSKMWAFCYLTQRINLGEVPFATQLTRTSLIVAPRLKSKQKPIRRSSGLKKDPAEVSEVLSQGK